MSTITDAIYLNDCLIYRESVVNRGDRLLTSESDVYRRQILTSKVGLRAERIFKRYNGRRLMYLVFK